MISKYFHIKYQKKEHWLMNLWFLQFQIFSLIQMKIICNKNTLEIE